MDKNDLLEALIGTLKEELRKSVDASKDAAGYATDDQARAESKWDTQGIEASYLAAGQAGQARQWAEAISLLEQTREDLAAPRNEVTSGAVVKCALAGGDEFFFISPVGGGEVLQIDGDEITVVTMRSPITLRILGKRAGESFVLGNGASGTILSVE